jgi:hypothetical protein
MIIHTARSSLLRSHNRQQRPRDKRFARSHGFFWLQEGTIVTFDQQEEFQLKDKIIKVIPAHQFLY